MEWSWEGFVLGIGIGVLVQLVLKYFTDRKKKKKEEAKAYRRRMW